MMKRFLIILWMTIFSVLPCYCEEWKQVENRVEKKIESVKQEIQSLNDQMKGEKNRLTKQLSELKKEVSIAQQSLKTSKNAYENLLEREEKLKEEAHAGKQNTKKLMEVIRSSGEDVRKSMKKSLITPLHPEFTEIIEPVTDNSGLPGMDDVRNLVEMLFIQMEESKKIQKTAGEYINAQGIKDKAEMVIVGDITGVYRDEGKTGYIRKETGFHMPAAISGRLPWLLKRDVNRFMEGKSPRLPIDMSGGSIVLQMSRNASLTDWINTGGLLIWPILTIGLIAFILACERFLSLFTIPVNTDNILERIRYLIEKKEIDEIHNLFDKQKRTPAVQLAKTALKYRDADRSVMENAIEETALGQMPRLERFLTTLSVLAAVAPLLGLLGTVTGMIHTFEGITLFGTGDPRMMSGGISEALITTQLGLAVAIPVIIAHHIFDRRVEKMMGDMDEKGTALVNLFSEKTRRKTA